LQVIAEGGFRSTFASKKSLADLLATFYCYYYISKLLISFQLTTSPPMFFTCCYRLAGKFERVIAFCYKFGTQNCTISQGFVPFLLKSDSCKISILLLIIAA